MAFIRFVLNGVAHQIEAAGVAARLRRVTPEAVREHGVRVGDQVYPVKQAFAVGCGVPRSQFTSQTAVRHLRALGFEVVSAPAANGPADSVRDATVTGVPGAAPDWPWEGAVQAAFVDLLARNGWTITSIADTASKAPGVDVLATKGARRLGAEVKGWPSANYADPRRATEVKRTQPSTQAGHWFSQALLKSVLLLDSHPGYETLMVLPDYPRYRDLTARTRTGRRAANIHVVLLGRTGDVTAEWWTP
jgi:hypothetical protein